MKTKLDKTHVQQLQKAMNESLNDMESKNNPMCVCLFYFDVDSDKPNKDEEDLFEDYLKEAVSRFTKKGYYYLLVRTMEKCDVVFKVFFAIEQYYINALEELLEVQDFVSPETYCVLFGCLVGVGDKKIRDELLKMKNGVIGDDSWN